MNIIGKLVKETSRLLFLFFRAFSERRERTTGGGTDRATGERGERDGQDDGRVGEGDRREGQERGRGHGRQFVTQYISDYFNSKSWYHGTIDPNTFDAQQDSVFNEYEMANIAKIAEWEERKSGENN